MSSAPTSARWRRSPVGFDVPTGTPLKVAYTPELAVLGSWQ
jgi:hypothetical protein